MTTHPIGIDARPRAHDQPLPALNRHSVRTLRHVRTVHATRRAVTAVVGAASLGIAVLLAAPAYAATLPVAATPAPVLQTLTVADAAAPTTVARDTYTVTSPPPLQWPVDPSTPIADGYGPRVAPCSGCSTMHEGVDYDAGNGTAVHAIAAGTVVETDNPGWASLGVHVAIEHVIDGVTIVSAYGHMQVGSMPLKVGDTVYAGEVIGRVGSTGASTGAHLHFEIRANGTTPVDPVAWMHKHLG